MDDSRLINTNIDHRTCQAYFHHLTSKMHFWFYFGCAFCIRYSALIHKLLSQRKYSATWNYTPRIRNCQFKSCLTTLCLQVFHKITASGVECAPGGADHPRGDGVFEVTQGERVLR